MMLMVNALIVILIPLIFGLFLLSLFLQKGAANFNPWEKLALSYPLGLSFITLIMFFLGLAGVSITFMSIILSVLAITLAIGVCSLRSGTFCLKSEEFKVTFPKLNTVEMLLAGLIGLKVIYVYFISIIKPMIDVDAFQQYSIVAKGIFYEKTFLTAYLSQFIQDKPLFPYLSQGWAFIGLQTTNDALFKILTPTLFLCLIVIFYSVLRKYHSRIHSLLFTFLLSTLPFLVFHVTTAYADFPQTFYYAVATFYLFLFMKEFALKNKEKSLSLLMIAFLFLGLSIWVKRAGIFLAGINSFVFIAYLLSQRKIIKSSDLKKFLFPIIAFFLIATPWILYGQAQTLIGTFRQIFEKAELPPSVAPLSPLIDKTDIVFSILLRKLFLYADWHLLWFLFLITLIFFYKKSFGKPLIFLLAIILLDISALFVQFRFGASFVWILDGTLLDRLVMNHVPIVLYFCAEAITPLTLKFSSPG